MPLGNSTLGSTWFEVVGDPPSQDDTRPAGDLQIVSPGYFQTINLPVVAGRAFTEVDRAGSTPVAIVSEAFVRRHLGERNPIVMRIRLDSESADREIVGVARQVKERPYELDDLVQIYVPHRQVPWSEAYLLVRGRNAGPDALTSSIRQAIGRVDKTMPVRNIVTLAGIASEATAHQRFRAVLVAAFAALALLLASVGIFGVLAYSVEQRRREFGVRIALGATTGDVLRLVAGRVAGVVAAGAAIGLLAALASGRLLSSFLFGVDALDPLTYLAVTAVMAVTAAIAAATPALRAARVDPAVTARAE
jgi:putative ABC transport system permease protein